MEDLTGFYVGEDRQFFVGPGGEVLELLSPGDNDGDLDLVAAHLPLSATPLDERFVLPSFVLRIAVHAQLPVPPPLDDQAVMAILDEIFWRRDTDGWVDAGHVCECSEPDVCQHVQKIEKAGFLNTDQQARVRLTSACLGELNRLSVLIRRRPFPAPEKGRSP